ncbi:MAG: peptide-methionine (S)-S-oxide reductase [Verrucomicrobia bacterium]|nr:MAG: peptide-methionine (S)-S-oxide reductase [Verrucomicrobiota bacterium]
MEIGMAAEPTPAKTSQQTATFGMGCFWCSQALFEKFSGITHIDCGYAGGHTLNPTYEDVSSGQTGHAEVVRLTFDPSKITYQQLLDIFWDVHDPTTLNRQGADEGTQYRSIILYETPEQKKLAEASKQREQAKFGKPLTTEIVPLGKFYRAEEYHQDYFKKNPTAPYCLFVISPKLRKLEAHPPQGIQLR